ncbi:hypothetical protein JHK84_045194 [Glycine max]|nr:hypothetical protein JHK86_045136 [Glycine max]KAG5108287.1 hypothetical protein JHK84_045194 [Glycine max]
MNPCGIGNIRYGHSLPFESVEAEEISGCRAAEVLNLDTKGRLVAGSNNRNEFVFINADETPRVVVTELSGQICQIYGDELEVTVNGEPFVDCNECAFPVCRPCYEYERREGNRVFPQCKTKYKRIKGSPRVEGDEEEDDTDDLESEFDIGMSLFNVTINDGDAVQPRPMDPKKDIVVYVYGSVAWKERMEDWKKKQSEKLLVVRHEGDKDSDELDDPDLPKGSTGTTGKGAAEKPGPACYVSNDGAAMLTFEALSGTYDFARKWVPFYKKFCIKPRAPKWYFAQKVDYLKDRVDAAFIRERHAIKV